MPPKLTPITKRFVSVYNKGLKEGLWSTQEEVALKLKYKNPNAISYIITGKRNIPLQKVILFCQEYDFSFSFMLTGKEDETGRLKNKIRDLEKIIRNMKKERKTIAKTLLSLTSTLPQT